MHNRVKGDEKLSCKTVKLQTCIHNSSGNKSLIISCPAVHNPFAKNYSKRKTYSARVKCNRLYTYTLANELIIYASEILYIADNFTSADKLHLNSITAQLHQNGSIWRIVNSKQIHILLLKRKAAGFMCILKQSTKHGMLT